MRITCGAPQGSVIGPTLWNLHYDNILKIPTLGGVSLIGYVELAVVATGKTLEHVQVKLYLKKDTGTTYKKKTQKCTNAEKNRLSTKEQTWTEI